MNKITEYLKNLSTEQIKEVIKGLEDNFSKEAFTVVEHALNELEKRLPEKEFVEFCDNY